MSHTLVIVRHGKAARPEPDVSDHGRPLAPRGRRDAEAVGRWLGAGGYTPDLVLSSTALRTRQTAERVVAALASAGAATPPVATPPATTSSGRPVDAPVVRYDDGLYLASTDALLAVVRNVLDDAETVLLVGHNPGIGRLGPLLDGFSAADESGAAGVWSRNGCPFPTAAVAVVALPSPWRAAAPGTGRLLDVRLPRE